ncbi:MAG: DDE-type integrase/transposase/recombinase, partial [Gammaproteobacteria bacterium]|nr:DDE-type integrase/transposase/recombinase [Gammaproteobacteria bacterium]
MDAVKSGTWTKLELSSQQEMAAFKSVRAQLSVDNGILHRGSRIVPPAAERSAILYAAHEGNLGIVRMKAAITKEFWWLVMGKQIERLISDCQGCQRSTKSRGQTGIPESSPIPTPEEAGEQWVLHVTGPFYNGRYEYLVVCIDYHSRCPEVLDTKDTTSTAIIKWLDIVWGRNGNPTGLVTNNGPQFISREFQNYLKGKDIHHYTTPVCHPQENGLTEVFNRTL